MSEPKTLSAALNSLTQVLAGVQFPLPLEGAKEHRAEVTALSNQVRDYLLPRASRLDAPLLAVVGGSTGAGKSTIVNSLLRQTVTKSGILRPTTRSPVLICNPSDRDWFRDGDLLPSLIRSDTRVNDSRAMQLVPLEILPPGLAILDAPDIDSVDGANRRVSRQLLRAADLWLFVTSGARYADAIGWELLEQAAERNAVIALVLNRCPPESEADLAAHLQDMLGTHGVTAKKVFSIPERTLSDNGLIPETYVGPIRAWLSELAAQSEARADVAIQTLAGSVRSLIPALDRLSRGVSRQTMAITELRGFAEREFQTAAAHVGRASSDGTMLRGEVLSRWQDFVGTGELMRSVEEQISTWRDKINNWFTGKQKAEEVQVAISDGLAALIVEYGSAACENVANNWAATPWGQDIIVAAPELSRLSQGFDAEAGAVIRSWQSEILNMVEHQGRGKRVKARILALGTNAIGATLIILVFASTGGLTGAEIGIAGGASVLAQRLLEGVYGEDAVRKLAAQAKADLDARVEALLSTQLARFEMILDELSGAPEAAGQLRAVATQLNQASNQAFEALTRPEGY